MSQYLLKIIYIYKIFTRLFKISNFANIPISILLEQILIMGPSSVSITIVIAFFIGLVFSLQIIKEFLYLNATNLLGCILSISFLRELSPILTSVVIIGRIGSYLTAELATMQITEQVEILYTLGVDPINYLIFPRIISLIIILPLLNAISFITSLLSSSFICFILYNVNPLLFFSSVISGLFFVDIVKSCIKTIIFAFFISIISCVCGLITNSGSKGVGLSTTVSVVISLLVIFILNFILSYYMFDSVESILKG